MKIRDLKRWLKSLKEIDIEYHSIKEIISQISASIVDFEIANYRFIHHNKIDLVLADELGSDLYILGCFNADFISEQTNLPLEMIESCQQAESYEAIGKGILMTCGIESFVQSYVSIDGYGNYFATYDGNEIELEDYIIFRTN